MEQYRKTIVNGRNAFEPLLEACSRMGRAGRGHASGGFPSPAGETTYVLSERRCVPSVTVMRHAGKQYLWAFYHVWQGSRDWYEAADLGP